MICTVYNHIKLSIIHLKCLSHLLASFKYDKYSYEIGQNIRCSRKFEFYSNILNKAQNKYLPTEPNELKRLYYYEDSKLGSSIYKIDIPCYHRLFKDSSLNSGKHSCLNISKL